MTYVNFDRLDAAAKKKVLESRLRCYYAGSADPVIQNALKTLEGDPYYYILPRCYQDNMSLNDMARNLAFCDKTTLYRHRTVLLQKLMDCLYSEEEITYAEN